MNIVLWIIAGLLALAFLGAGLTKLTQPKEKLKDRMTWTRHASAGQVKAIGALEVLAAIGLILPAALGIAPVFVPLAALGLVLLMVGAAIVHARMGEPKGIVTAVVLAVLAAIVVWGRFGPYHFAS